MQQWADLSFDIKKKKKKKEQLQLAFTTGYYFVTDNAKATLKKIKKTKKEIMSDKRIQEHQPKRKQKRQRKHQ